MLSSGAFVSKTDLLEYLEKRLSYFILAGEYELEPSLPEETRKRMVMEYRQLLEWVRRMPTRCMMADIGVKRRKPLEDAGDGSQYV